MDSSLVQRTIGYSNGGGTSLVPDGMKETYFLIHVYRDALRCDFKFRNKKDRNVRENLNLGEMFLNHPAWCSFLYDLERRHKKQMEHRMNNSQRSLRGREG